MIENLKTLDEKLFLFLNQFHFEWLDPIMVVVTRTEFWMPLYAMLIYLIFRNYKKEGWLILAGIVVTVLLADQITYKIMKPYFQRLRPSHELLLEGIIHIVDGERGGLYGFASSHAANTTGVAFYCYLFFREKYNWFWLIFLWPIIMSYTRIYLGLHYPGDILVGGMVGILSGYLGYRFFGWLKSKSFGGYFN